MMIQAEICQIFQKYGRQPLPYGQYRGQKPSDKRQYGKKSYRGGGYRHSAPRMSAPRHQNTMVANQAYSFNGLNGTITHPTSITPQEVSALHQ